MTRSVEIPEAAVKAAKSALDALPVCLKSSTVRIALAAALPYLVPAGDANAYHYSTEEIAAKIADRVPHADLDGFPLSQRIRIGKAVAPLFQELLPPPAPAGDGGLREALVESRAALESMRMFVYVETPTAVGTVEELERVLGVVKAALAAHPAAPAVPQPAGGWFAPETDEDRREIAAYKRQFEAEESAVPQPVDREALVKAIAGPSGDWLSRHQAGIAADRVLAVLAGEQEQVQ